MPTFKPGDEIAIPCEVGPGPFPTEKLVTLDTAEGPLSGFVRKENLLSVDSTGNNGYIRGTVKEVFSEIITVVVRGSFFTTTGLASLPREWASKHVQFAHAA